MLKFFFLSPCEKKITLRGRKATAKNRRGDYSFFFSFLNTFAGSLRIAYPWCSIYIMQPDMQPDNLRYPSGVVVVGRRLVVDGLVGYIPAGYIPADCSPADCTLADCTLADCILVGYSIRDAAAAGSTAAVVGVGIHAPEFCSDERMKVAGWRDGNIGSSRRRFRRSNR